MICQCTPTHSQSPSYDQYNNDDDVDGDDYEYNKRKENVG